MTVPRRVADPSPGARPADHRAAPRRRGEVLDEALLRAALDELAEGGYARLRMEAVAQRARTSKAALYRRWPTRAHLAVHAYLRFVVDDVEVPDSGSLRGDVLLLLQRLVASYASPTTAMFDGLLADARDDPELVATVREAMMLVRPHRIAPLVDRAKARGEISGEVSLRVLTLPIDLLRSELLQRGPEVPSDVLTSIVDEVFLPLVERGAR